jgi:hypothetical protein
VLRKSVGATLAVPWLVVCGLLALPTLARGAEPALDAHTLGINESVLHYCSHVDPEDAVKLQNKVKAMVQGTTDQTLAAVRADLEYRKAYDSITLFVGKIDQHNAQKFCARSLSPHR